MTATLPADPALARFSIVLPATWHTIDLDRATRDQGIERMMRMAIGTADRLAPLRRWAVLQYRAFLSEATRNGAFFAATLAQEVGGRPLSASALAFLGLSPLGAGGAPMEVEEMVAVLADPGPPGSPSDPTSGASLGESLSEPPAAVELPIGWCVRTRARTAAGLAGSDGEEAVVDVTRFFVPVAAWGHMLVMAFSTPMLSASDSFAVLFDQLALTARWQV